jgi:hypothetical protein
MLVGMPDEVLGGKVVGAPVIGVSVGSPSMGGIVFGAVVSTQVLSHGIWIPKATVLEAPSMVKASHRLWSGSTPSSPDLKSP